MKKATDLNEIAYEMYCLAVLFKMDVPENRWSNGAFLDTCSKRGQRYYKTKEAAKEALQRLLHRFNKEFEYDADGKRRETSSIGGGFAADVICDKNTDDMNRIVKWEIRKRYVTPWEIVDHFEEE